MVERCIDGVVAGLKEKLPTYGTDLAIDASDMPAYANGQRYLSNGGPERERYSDTDASWGHRSAVSTRKGGGFYGYRLHAAVCTATDLAGRMDGRDGERPRNPVRRPADRHGKAPGRDGRDVRAGQGLRHRAASTPSAPSATACH